ncbi:hypothetical protein [Streptomyces sp. TR02-1]|uniref:hypothetical protein n=1 Tax=Streptomyces sp. TR02-1 TaxID=3385977 RepID=UPI0039A09045
MLRHATAPARAFAQIPHAILRHPRLSAAAKTLLTWQLSLPADARQCLSDTARRARIGKAAFQRAKGELLAEGYVHEWRVRVEGGRFTTVQLVSNVPLEPAEAAALRDGRCSATPGAAPPAAGGPGIRSVGRQPGKNIKENTSPPTRPVPEAAAPAAAAAVAASAASPQLPETRAPETVEAGETATSTETVETPGRALRAAETFLRALVGTHPRLALSPRTLRDVAPLAVPWLRTDLSAAQIEHALTSGLDDVRSPVGVFRWRLRHALPEQRPAPAPAAPLPPPRVAGMRECVAAHTQPRLFTPPPGSDAVLCPECRADDAAPPVPAQPGPPGGGYALFRAARGPRPVPAGSATGG